MNRNIIIRADGSKEIGMGHLSRSSILYSKFLNEGNKPIIFTKKNSNGEEFLQKKMIKVKILPTIASIDEEIKYLLEQIEKNKTKLFVLDVLNYDKYHILLQNCKNNNVLSIVITDDSEKMDDINSDIVVNGNPSQLEYNYDYFPAKYLTGPRYFIMDQEYSCVENKYPNGKIKDILVTLGGADQNNLLFNVLKALDICCINVNIIVITTISSGYINKLNNFLLSLVNRSELYIDVMSLSHYWRRCDVAITAGGNSLFERIATRTPGVTICQLERQMKIAKYFEKLQVNLNWGLGIDINEEQLIECIRSFVDDSNEHLNQYLNAPKVTEGRGLYYLNQVLNNYY